METINSFFDELEKISARNSIISKYEKAGVEPPVGKGMHTPKFHDMAIALMKKKGFSKDRAYATAMKTLGRDRSVMPDHRDPEYKK